MKIDVKLVCHYDLIEDYPVGYIIRMKSLNIG